MQIRGLVLRITVFFVALVFQLPVVIAQTDRQIVVDTIQDNQPSTGCTLREAISVANAGLFDALGCGATSKSGDGGGVWSENGGIFGVQVKSSVIAGNLSETQGNDCFGFVTSQGFNLVGRNDGCVSSFPGGNPNPQNDLVGTAILELDPLLAPLQEARQFAVPLSSSPVVDVISAGDCEFLATSLNPLFSSGDPVLIDQRGQPRDAFCDIGAVESDLLLKDGFES